MTACTCPTTTYDYGCDERGPYVVAHNLPTLADVYACPVHGPKSSPPQVWQPIDTAPHDRLIAVLIPLTTIKVGGEFLATPDLVIIRRVEGLGSGYWATITGDSVAESYVKHSLWAELDALPLKELFTRGADPAYRPQPFNKEET